MAAGSGAAGSSAEAVSRPSSNSCEVSRVRYPRRDECPGHDSPGDATPLGHGIGEKTLGDLLERAEKELGAGAVLDFSRDVVLELSCPECGRKDAGAAVLGEISEKDAACPACGTHRVVDIAASASRDGPVDLTKTPGEIGLPPFDIMVARQGLDAQRAWLFDGDADRVLGPLVNS